jgi:diaminohydroxyphosphoribosylaminopyrimidine deaminase / 5-amino-6-(5-phosphoribosylamino)uracil reductase
MADFWMAEALRLARDGSGALAHPNPRVGAVLVRDGKKVGEGFHVYDNRDHAEIVALREAGEQARGATLYINLEPCCTTGRTGPCTKALITAGVSHVYAAMPDPNPAVAGRGFAELRRAGIEIQVGNGETEARRLNEDFAKWIKTGEPFVTLKSAMTLDAKIATRGGKTATDVTGAAARAAVHQRFRHAADALITGIGTVLADDPMLNDRSGQPRRNPLLRVVLDSKLRLPLKSKLVKSAQGDVAVFTAASMQSKGITACGRGSGASGLPRRPRRYSRRTSRAGTAPERACPDRSGRGSKWRSARCRDRR